MRKIIYHMSGTNHLGKGEKHVIDNFTDYRNFKTKSRQFFQSIYKDSCEVHTNLMLFIQTDWLNNPIDGYHRPDWQGFDELNIVTEDKLYYARFAEGGTSKVIEHNFDTKKELRYAHNLQKMLVAGGLIPLP